MDSQTLLYNFSKLTEAFLLSFFIFIWVHRLVDKCRNANPQSQNQAAASLSPKKSHDQFIGEPKLHHWIHSASLVLLSSNNCLGILVKMVVKKVYIPAGPSKGCQMDGNGCHSATPEGLKTTRWRVAGIFPHGNVMKSDWPSCLSPPWFFKTRKESDNPGALRASGNKKNMIQMWQQMTTTTQLWRMIFLFVYHGVDEGSFWCCFLPPPNLPVTTGIYMFKFKNPEVPPIQSVCSIGVIARLLGVP